MLNSGLWSALLLVLYLSLNTIATQSLAANAPDSISDYNLIAGYGNEHFEAPIMALVWSPDGTK